MSPAPTSGGLEAGGTLGRWKLLGRLGRGGMGEVHVAEDRERGGRRVALKVLSPAFAAREDSALRFERERELMGRLAHPNVVPCLGPLERDAASGHAFFPMELVVGRSAADLVAEHGPFDVAEALALVADVARALEAAHAVGLVHRDVKPSNVLVERSGRARLADFGLARAVDETRLTATGGVLGTPAYMAPEQAEGKDVGPAADLYALGVLAYELLVGRPPFQASSALALLRLHVDATPRPPTEARPGIPPRLDALVLRLLAKDPTARGTARDVLAEVAAIRAGLAPSSAPPPGTLAETAVWICESVERETRDLAALAETEPRGAVKEPSSVEPPRASRGLPTAAAVLAAVLVLTAGGWVATHRSGPRLATVRTRSGPAQAGFVVRTDADALVLRDSAGLEKRVPLDDVLGIDYPGGDR